MPKSKLLLSIVFLLLAGVGTLGAQTVTVAWDPNPERDLASYVVHWGTRSGAYSSRATVPATQTSWVSPALTPGATYYFAVQAVNVDGLASSLSEEVSTNIAPTGRSTGAGTGAGAGASSLVAGDFSGSGRTDLTVFRRSRGEWFVRGLGMVISLGGPQDVPVPGDYDGDGLTDIAVWSPETGVWSILKSADSYNPSTMIQVRWGEQASGDIPVPADYDGDGRLDIAVWRPTNGTWYVLRSSAQYSWSSCWTVQWGVGASGDVPVPGDFDGDRRADIGVWRPGSGMWFVLRSSENYRTSGFLLVQWGAGDSGDIPVPADYDGDSRTDIGVWRPGNGTWYILKSADDYAWANSLIVQWGDGSQRDVPVPGDYDGDGRADMGVWRPGNGVWYSLASGSNYSRSAFLAIEWGVESLGDTPATGTTLQAGQTRRAPGR